MQTDKNAARLIVLLIAIMCAGPGCLSCKGQQSLYVADKYGYYSRRGSDTIPKQSYNDVRIRNWRGIQKAFREVMTEERRGELGTSPILVTLHINGVERKVAYVSFLYGSEDAKRLTDEEMEGIEDYIKKMPFVYDVLNDRVEPWFNRYVQRIRPSQLPAD